MRVAVKSTLHRVVEWLKSKLNLPKPKFRPHLAVIKKEINFYKSQLRFPEENSDYVSLSSKKLQNSLNTFNVISKITDTKFKTWLKQFDTDGEDIWGVFADNEEEEYEVSYKFVSRCLYNILDIMKEVSFEILRESPRIQILRERARKMDLPIG